MIDDDRVAKTRQMRALDEDQRRELIDEAPNVIGFDRMLERAKQVALRDAYRKPAPGGTA